MGVNRQIIGLWGAWEDHWYVGCMGGSWECGCMGGSLVGGVYRRIMGR